MLVLNLLKLLVSPVLLYFDNFEGIQDIGLLSPGEVDFSEGSLAQKFENLEIFIREELLFKEIELLSSSVET